jgi:hypothetical protein
MAGNKERQAGHDVRYAYQDQGRENRKDAWENKGAQHKVTIKGQSFYGSLKANRQLRFKPLPPDLKSI